MSSPEPPVTDSPPRSQLRYVTPLMKLLLFPLKVLVFAGLLVVVALRLVVLPLDRLLKRLESLLASVAHPLKLLAVLLFLPVHLLAFLLDPPEGQDLESDIVRPMFSLPYAFARGAWRATPEQPR